MMVGGLDGSVAGEFKIACDHAATNAANAVEVGDIPKNEMPRDYRYVVAFFR
jgi:hypothetical protein